MIGRAAYPPGPLNPPLASLWRQRNLLPFLLKLQKEYGDFAHFRVGRRHYYLANDPESVKRILVTDAGKFTKGPAIRNARVTLGNGLLTADAELHRKQRRLISPVFHPSRVATYAELFTRYAGEMAGTWRDGETVDIHERMTALTLEVVTKALFGGELADEVGAIGRSMAVLVTMFDRARNPLAPVLNKLPLPSNLRFLKALRHVEATIQRFVERKRAHGLGNDLLSLLLKARDADDPASAMSDKQLRDEAITLFTAGHETTANALVFTWYLLAQNAEAERKLHEEIDAVLPGDRLPTAEDLDRLLYTRNVLAESMRLYPPAWVIAREVLGEYELLGHRIPAGSVVLLSQFLLHRDARFWPEPMRFDPDRFAEGNREARPRFAYFPFGSGPRSCVGESFAWVESTLLLATLAKQWRPTLVDPSAPLRLHPTITLRPKDPLFMALRRR